MLSGVVILGGCSTYRIEIKHQTDRVWYTPMFKSSLRWKEHYTSFYTQKEAEGIIKDWKSINNFRKEHKKPKYIYIK